MAYASWIPASPGTGMPRYGVGLYETAAISHWRRQVGLPIRFISGYTGFSNIAGWLSGAYYATHTRDVGGTYSSSANNIIPVIGTSLATVDGAMTLANNAAGAHDSDWAQMIANLFGGGNYSEIWLRLNYESNIQTTSGGYTNGNTSWAPQFKAAFEHVAPVCYAAVPAGKTLRILFDTCPLNAIITPNGNSLSLYAPNPATWDILGLDLYTGNCYPVDRSPWTGYAAQTPFTLNATAGTTASTDDNAWAADFTPGAAQGGQGYSYDNMAHWLCFQDGRKPNPNGGGGQSLYSLVQYALSVQKPLFHPEFGGVGLTYNGATITGQGHAGQFISTLPIQQSYPTTNSFESAVNDLNFFPYMKRAFAAIEVLGVPELGFVLWDQLSGNLLSGPDAYSGGVAPGMRPFVQVFGYAAGHYGATDPVISIAEIYGGAAPPPYTVPTAALPINQPHTVQVNCNYPVTLAHFQVDFGTGAGSVALPGTPALVGANSFSFSWTPTTAGSFSMVIHDTTLGYQSPPNDYVVTGVTTLTTYTWDPAHRDGWTLSNGNLTAHSPNNNTNQPINVCTGTPALPTASKIYWEYTVSGSSLKTAFGVGWGVQGQNVGQHDITGPAGKIVANTTGSNLYYNLSVNIDNAQGATVVADPQGNSIPVPYNQTHPGTVAAPNQWLDGDVISVALDRVNGTVQYWQNGSSTGRGGNSLGTTHAFAGLGNTAIYPLCTSWFTAGPVATINDGTTAFKYPQLLAGLAAQGFKSLAAWGGGAVPTGGPTAVTIVTVPASNVTSGVAYSVTATVTAGGPWHAAADLTISANTTGSGQSFGLPGGGAPVLSAGNTVATFSGLSSGLLQPHQIYIQDAYYNAVWGPYNYNVVTGGPVTRTLQVSDASIRFSEYTWKGDSGRAGSVSRTTWCMGSSFMMRWNASASPTLQVLGSITQASAAEFHLNYILNGTAHTAIVSTGGLTLSGINPSASNTLQVFFGNNHNGVYTEWTVTGVVLDTGSVPQTVPASGLPILWYGDSITEGNQVEALQSHAWLVTQQIGGFDYANQSAGGSDLNLAGNEALWSAGICPASGVARWNNVAAGVSMLDSAGQLSSYGATGTSPGVIVINAGTNAEFANQAAGVEQARMTAFLTQLRAAAPGAIIEVIVPFMLYNSTNYPRGLIVINEIKAAVSTVNSNGGNIQLIDLGANLSSYMISNNLTFDNVHPTVAGHAYLTTLIAPMIQADMTVVVPPPPPPPPGPGAVGIPYYGIGMQLAYSNGTASKNGLEWAWFAANCCIGRICEIFVGWKNRGDVTYNNNTVAGWWKTDPDTNGQNSGRKCIPLIGFGGTTCEAGGMTWASEVSGAEDATLRGYVDTWANVGWKVIAFRWGYEDNYPTANSGVSASPAYNNGPFPNNPPGANVYTPWHNEANSNFTTYCQKYVPAWRHCAAVVHAEAAAKGVKVLFGWGPCNQNSTVGDDRNYYPDSDLSDGRGLQCDGAFFDWYADNVWGGATQNKHPNYQNQQAYTAYTGTPIKVPSTGNQNADVYNSGWSVDVGSRIYYMDWSSGNAPSATPLSRNNYTGGYGSYQSNLWGLQHNCPLGSAEYGGSYSGGKLGGGTYGPPTSPTAGAPGSIFGEDSHGNPNYPTIADPNNWTTDYPWLGGYARSRMNWLMTPGTPGVSAPGTNGVRSVQPLFLCFWQNQGRQTLNSHRTAFPELFANPDAGMSGGITPVGKSLILNPINPLVVNQPATINFSYLAYTPAVANLRFNPDGSGYVALPAGAQLNATGGSGTFSFTPTTVGSFSMLLEDVSVSPPIVAFSQPYSVAQARPAGIGIRLPTAIGAPTIGVAFNIQIAFDGYRPNQSNVQFGHNVGGVSFVDLSQVTHTWSANGQLLTVTVSDGIAQPHFNVCQDVTFSPPLQATEVDNPAPIAAGGLGATTVTVSPPISIGTTPSITLTAPGTRTEASLGAGVSVPFQATTLNIPAGNISWKVVQNGGAGPDETAYVTAALSTSGIANFTALMLHSGDIVRAVDNIGSGLVAHTWTNTGLNPSTYTLSNGNKTASIAGAISPNVWTSIWANAPLAPGSKSYFEVTVHGMVTGTASGVGVGSVADGFIAGTTTQLNNPAYQVSLGYNGSTAATVNGVSQTFINPRQWPNSTQPPGWQLTPGTGLEAFTYIDAPSSGGTQHGWTTSGGLNTGTWQFSNASRSAHMPQGPSSTDVQSRIFTTGSIAPGSKVYFEMTVTGAKTGSACGLGVGGGGYMSGGGAFSSPADLKYYAAMAYNGGGDILNNGTDINYNPRQWAGTSAPPGFQTNPGSGLEPFTYMDASGNVWQGYATINTSLPLAGGNSLAHVCWGNGPTDTVSGGEATAVGVLVDLVANQITFRWKVLATGFTQTLAPRALNFSGQSVTPTWTNSTPFLANAGMTIDFNGGATAFAMALPAGYTAFDGGSSGGGNVFEGYATINTGYLQANGNTNAHVIWGGAAGASTVVGMLVDQINNQFSQQWTVVVPGSSGLIQTIGPFPIPFTGKQLTPVTGCQTAFLIAGGLGATINGGATAFAMPLPTGYQAYDGGAVTQVTADSSPVTIIEVSNSTATISMTDPGTLTQVAGNTGVTTNTTVTTTNLSGNFYWGVQTSGGVLEAALQAQAIGAGGSTVIHPTLLHSGDQIVVQDLATAPTIQKLSAPVTIIASSSQPHLSISNPGTVFKAKGASFVIVPLVITAVNVPSPVYWQTKTAAGVAYGGIQTQALSAQGSASINATLNSSGDTVEVLNAPAAATVSALSQPVTIAAAPAGQIVAVSAPGTVTEASLGAGVTPSFVVQTTNVPGGIAYEVRKSTRAIEVAYQTALPDNAAITVPASIPDQGGAQAVSIQVGFSYVPDPTKIQFSRATTAAGLTWQGITPPQSGITATFDGSGQLLTITGAFGTQAQHQFAVRDTTPATALQSAVVNLNVVAAGGGGTVTVPPPPTAPSPQQFSFNQLMLSDQDYLQATPVAAPPQVAGLSACAWITWTGTGPYVYTVNLLNTSSDTPIGTAWFFWSDDPFNYLTAAPTLGTTPAGWTPTIVAASGYSLEYVAATPLAVGAAAIAFTFTSADTPARMFGQSTVNPIDPVCLSTIYAGAPQVGAKFEFVATDNTLPGVTGLSAAVNIRETGSPGSSITISAPGTVNAPDGQGATVPLTVATVGISTQFFWEVVSQTGAVVFPYTAQPISSGFTAAVTDNFTRADTTAGAAGSNTGAGNGWIDPAGGVWNIASNQLVGTTATHDKLDFANRPVSEAAQDSRIAVTFVYRNSFDMSFVVAGVRNQPGNQQSYYCRIVSATTGDNSISLVRYSGGETFLLTGVPNALVDGHSYTLDMQATGVNPTNLQGTLLDAATGAQKAQLKTTDSFAGLQNAAGVPFMLVYCIAGRPAHANFTNAVTYSGAGGAVTIQPHFSQTGDRVQIVDNTTSPTITQQSSPITITTPVATVPLVSAAVLRLAVASNNSGFIASLNINAQNFSAAVVYIQVNTPTGTVETPYYPVTLGQTTNGVTFTGSANVDVPFAQSGDIITIVDQVTPAPNTSYSTAPLLYSAPVAATVTMTVPSTLYVGLQTLSGIISPSGTPPVAIYGQWVSGATAPQLSTADPNAVLMSIDPTQSPEVFYGAFNVTGSGIAGAFYLSTGGNVWFKAFTATPVTPGGGVTATVNPPPTPFNPGGPQPITGTITDDTATLLVCLRASGFNPPVAADSDVVPATINSGIWTAMVIAGPVGVLEFVWLSINGAGFYNAGTMTPQGAITLAQVGQQYANTPYTVPCDFNYILNIPSNGPIPATVQYSETGAAPYRAVSLAPNSTQVAHNAGGNTRLILGLVDPLPTGISLVVQDSAPPGGGSALFSNIVHYTVAQQPQPTGSPFINAYNPLIQQTGIPWNGIADLTYAVTNLNNVSVAYNGTGLVPATTLVAPQGCIIRPNPTVAGASRLIFTLLNTVARPNEVFQVQDATPPGGSGPISSAPQHFSVVAFTPSPTPPTHTWETDWSDGSINVQVKPLNVTIVKQGYTASGIATTATLISLFQPAQTIPGRTVVLAFSFVGLPMAFDYTINGGVSWTTALAGNTGINNATLTGTVTIPAGVPAGSYPKGQVAVRDSNAHSVVAFAPGLWVVSAFNPATASSFTPLFGVQAANPAFTVTDPSGHVTRLNDLFGSAKFLTTGPTLPPNNPAGSAFSGVNAVPLLRTAGVDSGQIALDMNPTTNPAAFDNYSNYFGAGLIGQNGGVNDTLIAMLNQTDLTLSHALIVWGVSFDPAQPGATGPIWGYWPSATTAAYITVRWQAGQLQALYSNTSTGYLAQTTPALSPGVGLHVVTLQQIGTLLQLRVDGGAWSSVTLPTGELFAATTFSYGGNLVQGIGNITSGNPPPLLFDAVMGTGTPSAADIANFEAWIGHSFGHA